MAGEFNARHILIGAKVTRDGQGNLGIKVSVLHSQLRDVGEEWDERVMLEAHQRYDALYMATVYGGGGWAFCEMVVSPKVTTKEVEGVFDAIH